ncbi:hypothetical protein IWQ57_000315 [Coemansia nantahalensis]|uniref:Uncharacterized protein n=1 Tax=Coemansia nantahalensis TaxID=2789366 RepID=A0ACC1K8H1_9FUNG|nr:hypothetical protein IWQ57_000315 [Coemansia nantahalensis]
MVLGAKLEPRVPSIDDESLGQIADYVLHVWAYQPTRTFVPVLFARGRRIDLLLFTRDKWYRAHIGQILFSSEAPGSYAVENVRETTAALWFILTLSPDQFGHFCDVRDGFGSLVFTHGPEDKANATATVSRISKHRVLLKELLPRPLHMLGRFAHIYKAEYKGKDVILKLSWMPADRQPEGAVYDALAARGIGDVPEVFDSGILCSSLCGYRLEYLVLQDCGETLDDHLAKLRADDEDDDVIEAKLIQVIRRVSACLVGAWNAGIIHRDISTGNIAVDGDKVTVIDWGCAKVCEWAGLEDVTQRWDIDFEEICEVESTYDKQAGTPIFMSIGLLFERKKRGIYDDLESLFYVALYAVGSLYNEEMLNVRGFELCSNKTLARARVSVLGDRNRYLESFGVEKVGDDLHKVFEAMRQCLFWSPTGYIGSGLWEDEYFRREPDWQLAAEFMDEPTVQMLKQAQHTQDGFQQPPTPASVN